MAYELPQFKPRMFGMKIRYPPQLANRILKQGLQGLAFLHKNGIAHGDFQPGNILFATESIDSYDEASLRQEENVETYSISAPVERLDGKEDKWAPRYLCMGQPLAAYVRFPEDLQVKLSDMGGGKGSMFPCFEFKITNNEQRTFLAVLQRSPSPHVDSALQSLFSKEK